MATVTCPACGRALEVEAAYRDWTVRCPHCDGEFVPDEAPAASAPPRAEARPRRRPRDDDDDDDDDEDDENPDRAAAREEARHVVSAPAAWLEVCGWFSALASLGVTAVCLVMAAEVANNPQANQNDEPAAMLVFIGCCAGVLGVPYGVAMAVGARNMRNLSNRGWAMTGAILGVASFSVFGVFGLFQTGFGAWALIALDKPVVREAFGLPARRDSSRRSRRDRDRDD